MHPEAGSDSKALEALNDKLQATLVELVHCRAREAQYRQESQTLLAGLGALADARTLEQVLLSLIRSLQPFIGFEQADVLSWEGEAGVTHLSTEPAECGQGWRHSSLFARALGGETLVIYDPAQLPEFAGLAGKPGWASLMLTGLHAPGFTGILLCRHSVRGGLDLQSKAALARCQPLISQALVNIAYRARLQQQVALKTRELQASERRFRRFAAMASDWFWETDGEHRLSYVSAPGYEGGVMTMETGRSLYEVTHEREGEPWEKYRRLVEGRQAIRAERVRINAGGLVRWMEVNAEPLFDRQGHFCGYSGTARDIGRQIRREQELAQARDQAEAANRAKSQFLAMMTHEIRSPMNAVMGMLDLLQHEGMAPAQQTLLDHASHSARLLQTIIDDVLDFSKIEAHSLALHCERFTPRPLSQAIMEPWQAQAREKGLTLTCELDEALPEALFADPVRLSQIINNLLGNALKFTEQGGVVLKIGWRDECLRVEVQDTGIGIAEADQARLFEPFTQVDSSATRHRAGTGLGLSISKRLVALMGGELCLTSRLGVGSCFWFSLPGLGLPCESEVRASPPSNALRPLDVLVVEDSPINQLVVSLMLEKLVSRVRLAGNGLEALAQVAEQAPDLILMDMRMPQMDGLEATRLLRELGYRMPIVALTANAMAEDRACCLTAGMTDFLAKPISLARLRDCLQRHC
ncbi:PAS domain-containing hybrid sensor histidine kinase/response regulator [Aeromonas bivalvium]|uniref:PAS domain-containing hybrid sensor histidine kinase/response regulator n=1 Tax=Aeromonas bivalvium TaxID=440079 RepID=UPI0038D257F9